MHITLALRLSTRRTAVITKTEARALGGTAAAGAATAPVSFLALAPIQIGPSILFEKLFAYNKRGTKRDIYSLLVTAANICFLPVLGSTLQTNSKLNAITSMEK